MSTEIGMNIVSGDTPEGPHHVRQLELVCAIMKELDKQGIKSGNTRQMNSIATAANIIVAEFAKPHVMARPSMGLVAWRQCDDVGLSSDYMAGVLSGYSRKNNHPHDPDDFGRCVRLLEAVPGFRGQLNTVKEQGGPVWAALVDRWDELEQLWHEESPSGDCPKLYAALTEIITSTLAQQPKGQSHDG